MPRLLLAQIPIIISQPVSWTQWVGGYVTFSVGISNAGPFTCQWQFNGTNLSNNFITTVAGNGAAAYAGDGRPATTASLYYPQGVGFDVLGNLYIADNNNDRVRRVDTNGIITTVAGNGAFSSSGGGSFSSDGGAATNAGLYRPNNVTFDAAGNMFIADIFNNRVRKVDTNGIITTVAGKTTTQGFSGDGGAATNAVFNYPADVAFDGRGNWFIADLFNHRVRKVDTNGIINTVAGGGSQTPGDGGAATNAALSVVQGVALDTTGNLYIADTGAGRVQKVDTNGIITTIAGGGANLSANGIMATNAQLYKPWGVALDAIGNIFFADEGYNLVRKVDTNGIITTVAGNIFAHGFSGDGGAATNAALYGPACVALDGAGDLFIADWNNNRIRKVTNTQGPILSLSNVGSGNQGWYQLVVTGAGGSVTSSVVNLTVVSTPLIYQTEANSNGSIRLNCVSKPGSTNIVFCAASLVPPVVWQPVSTNTAAPDGDWQFTDTKAVGNQNLFYRFVMQ